MASVCSLGVLLDPGLFLEDQVAAVAKGAYYQFQLVRQLEARPFLDKKGLVTYQLNYYNALFMGLPLKTSLKLQMVQNAIKCLINGATRLFPSCNSHIERVALAAHCCPCPFKGVLTYKALYVLEPRYSVDHISVHISMRPLRFSGEGFFQVFHWVRFSW